MAGFLNWTDYFGDAFKRVNRTVGVDEKLVVYAPDYMRNLTKLIEAHLGNATLRRDLENYMAWQLVKSLRNALSKKYQDAGKYYILFRCWNRLLNAAISNIVYFLLSHSLCPPRQEFRESLGWQGDAP